VPGSAPAPADDYGCVTEQVLLRLHAGAAAVLDDLVEPTGAESCTQLITAALHYHLG
jgi:hypothetical protein